jgi:hypothetical protein
VKKRPLHKDTFDNNVTAAEIVNKKNKRKFIFSLLIEMWDYLNTCASIYEMNSYLNNNNNEISQLIQDIFFFKF